MGDAYCGPSNPLQNLQKHTTADRSLQQDRLTSRQRPGQAFRSSPQGPGLLDHEFADFANAPVDHSSLAFAESQHNFPQPPQSFHTPQASRFTPAPAPDWASAFHADFNRLNISQPGPSAVSQQPQATGGWGQEFLQMRQPAQPSLQQAQPMFLPQRGGAFTGFNSFHSNLAQPSYASTPQMSTKGKETAMHDDELFAHAFDQAAANVLDAHATNAEPPTLAHDPLANSVQERPQAEREDVLNNIAKTGSAEAGVKDNVAWEPERRAAIELEMERQSRLADEELAAKLAEDRQIEQEGGTLEIDGDLAATAGELLDKVKHESDEKFKNSEFLQLMMRIRDGAATIRHGQMLDGTDDNFSASIPAQEQDHDSGRAGEVRMTGALPTSNPSVRSSSVEGHPDLTARTNWREQFGAHPVDDFY